jgi:hypothetical protein
MITILYACLLLAWSAAIAMLAIAWGRSHPKPAGLVAEIVSKLESKVEGKAKP